MLNKTAEFNIKIIIGVNYKFLQSEKNFLMQLFFVNQNPKKYKCLNSALDQYWFFDF